MLYALEFHLPFYFQQSDLKGNVGMLLKRNVESHRK